MRTCGGKVRPQPLPFVRDGSRLHNRQWIRLWTTTECRTAVGPGGGGVSLGAIVLGKVRSTRWWVRGFEPDPTSFRPRQHVRSRPLAPLGLPGPAGPCHVRPGSGGEGEGMEGAVPLPVWPVRVPQGEGRKTYGRRERKGMRDPDPWPYPKGSSVGTAPVEARSETRDTHGHRYAARRGRTDRTPGMSPGPRRHAEDLFRPFAVAGRTSSASSTRDRMLSHTVRSRCALGAVCRRGKDPRVRTCNSVSCRTRRRRPRTRRAHDKLPNEARTAPQPQPQVLESGPSDPSAVHPNARKRQVESKP